MSPSALLGRIDRLQLRHRTLAFPAAVIKKYAEDQGGALAALIAYWAFFSLFPLLLVFVTVLGFVLHGNAAAQRSVLHSALSQYPIIGSQLRTNISTIRGSGLDLAIGVIGALLAGLGVTGAVQSAFGQVWRVPRRERPGFLAWRVRGVALLALFGSLVIVSTVAAGFVTAQAPHGLFTTVLAVVLALIANLLLFGLSFRLFTERGVPTRQLLPGIVTGALLWQLLQHTAGYYVTHVVRHAQDVGGVFALVLGLLVWLYIASRVTVLAAEINVVRARRLWPRSLLSGSPLEADLRALRSAARVEERIAGERIDVRFEPPERG